MDDSPAEPTVLGKRERVEGNAGGVQGVPANGNGNDGNGMVVDDDDEDEVGPMPMPEGQEEKAGARKKRKGVWSAFYSQKFHLLDGS